MLEFTWSDKDKSCSRALALIFSGSHSSVDSGRLGIYILICSATDGRLHCIDGDTLEMKWLRPLVGKSFPWTIVSMTGNACLGIATESSESCTSIYKKSLLAVFSRFLLYSALIFFLLSHLSSDTLDNGHCVSF